MAVPFPVAAVEAIVRIVSEAISSGDLLGVLWRNWPELVDAVVALLKWALATDAVGAGVESDATDLQAQLSTLVFDCPVVIGRESHERIMATAKAGILPWISIIMWLIQLLFSAKEQNA